VKIPRAQADAIAAHARSGYPHEVCGVLVGTAREGVVRVARVVAAANRETERPAVRYQIAPEDLIGVQRAVRAEGLDIVGYYHSHPDHPAQASRFDTERAWSGYVYLIVAVHEGKPVDANAFVADQDGGPFHAESLDVF
jgi:proteasome lid subunit RPN8/RPN11